MAWRNLTGEVADLFSALTADAGEIAADATVWHRAAKAAAAREAYRANPELGRARSRAYRAKNREKRRAASKAYYWAHRDYFREHNKRWHSNAANAAKRAEQARQRHAADPGRRKRLWAIYYRRHRQRLIAAERRNRLIRAMRSEPP